MIFRWYQKDAISALLKFVLDESNKDKHPIAAEPTGSGKTPIILGVCDEILSIKFDSKILVLSHVKEILEQNYNALVKYFDGSTIGLYSAGLDSKTIHKITVAGIQSVWRKPELFQQFDIIIIDECHLVTIDEEGMYRKFLAMLDAVYIGLTATPFRLGHGYINEGKGALFTDIVHDMSSVDNFNKLVAEGWLSRLITKGTDIILDASGVRITAGDYNLKDLSEEFDRDEITENIVGEIIRYGHNYKKWLAFAIDIDHAEHITECLINNGIKTCCVHSKMTDDRDEVISDYRQGVYRAAVNVDVMTTGLDIPSIDLIASLCHTKSPVKHVQSLGRGSRVVYADGYDLDAIEGRLDAIAAGPKPHCLVLDFVGNLDRLGPINDVLVKKKGDKKGDGEPILKQCPECQCHHHPTVKICDICDHVFEFKVNLNITSSNAAVIKEKIVGWIHVDSVEYSIHEGTGKPDSLLVTYVCGISRFKEWVVYDHPGKAGFIARHRIKYRLIDDIIPVSVPDLYSKSDNLKVPKKIKVDTTDKYAHIIDFEF